MKYLAFVIIITFLLSSCGDSTTTPADSPNITSVSPHTAQVGYEIIING